MDRDARIRIMKEFILELYSEEIPARFQKDAETGFYGIFKNFFEEKEISFNNLKVYISPCRIIIDADISEYIPEKIIETKGPKIDANPKAIEGFCKANFITESELQKKVIDGSEFYFCRKKIEKQKFTDILAKSFTDLLNKYTWPKSMIWSRSDMRWVRPLRNILCIFDDKHVDISFYSLNSTPWTYGHKFLANSKININSKQDYYKKLSDNFVVVSREERKKIILEQSVKAASNFSLNIDESLIEELAGICEYPTILMGKIDDKFLDLPQEVLITSMKNHQKYLTASDANGKLAPFFIFPTNLALKDYSEVIAGNEKVLSARLADALYFYKLDKSSKFDDNLKKLESVIFHAKLGTIREKITRIEKLVEYIDPSLKEAALLCKTDLVSEMVGEFPELQGIMASYYAKHKSYNQNIVDAIRDHYKPMGADDATPKGTAAILSIVDKIDSLVSLYLAGERATGSKDPYALRRYCLGIIRTIIDNNFSCNLLELIKLAASNCNIDHSQNEIESLLEFFEERLKHYLKSEISLEVLNATIKGNKFDKFLDLVKSAHSLQKIISSISGKNLLSLYKRAKNVSSDQDLTVIINDSNINLSEKTLYNKIQEIENKLKLDNNIDFDSKLLLLLELENPLSNFFENNLVNSENENEQKIRKTILIHLSKLFESVANFNEL
jgi:glycyl-tRNA synthetase beta chain